MEGLYKFQISKSNYVPFGNFSMKPFMDGFYAWIRLTVREGDVNTSKRGYSSLNNYKRNYNLARRLILR